MSSFPTLFLDMCLCFKMLHIFLNVLKIIANQRLNFFSTNDMKTHFKQLVLKLYCESANQPLKYEFKFQIFINLCFCVKYLYLF